MAHAVNAVAAGSNAAGVKASTVVLHLHQRVATLVLQGDGDL